MSVTRRGLGGLFAAFGFGVAAAGDVLKQGMNGGSPFPPPPNPGDMGGMPATTLQYGDAQGNAAVPRLMEDWQAFRHLVLNDKEALATIRSMLFDGVKEQVSSMDYIDPDLAVLRAISPMVKLTLQRQRMVERQLKNRMSPYRSLQHPEFGEMVMGKIRKLMWGE